VGVSMATSTTGRSRQRPACLLHRRRVFLRAWWSATAAASASSLQQYPRLTLSGPLQRRHLTRACRELSLPCSLSLALSLVLSLSFARHLLQRFHSRRASGSAGGVAPGCPAEVGSCHHPVTSVSRSLHTVSLSLALVSSLSLSLSLSFSLSLSLDPSTSLPLPSPCVLPLSLSRGRWDPPAPSRCESFTWPTAPSREVGEADLLHLRACQ